MDEKRNPPMDSDHVSSEDMVAALYDELHRLAQRERWRAGRPDSWQTTAIIHEAYLKLHKRDNWASREHFLATAVTTMRHILVDAARARLALKRNHGEGSLPLDSVAESLGDESEDQQIVMLHNALGDLAQIDPKLAKLVDCRFFAGLNEQESARILGVSDRTVRRLWIQARAWIHSEMEIAS